MDWANKTWINEDKQYSPKRKVNNKNSRMLPHISGSFYSQKMKKIVGYESLWGECLFYYLLELDPLTIRYYEQPIEVPIRFLDKNMEIKKWMHVPDVLVFRQGASPFLLQIKGSSKFTIEQKEVLNKNCQIYANERNWRYAVIYPKSIPRNIISNITFLWGYIKKEKHYDQWIPEIIYKMTYYQRTSILALAKGFSAKIDFRYVLPIIYHLIATGTLKAEINQVVNERSMVEIGDIIQQISSFFQPEGELFEALWIKNR